MGVASEINSYFEDRKPIGNTKPVCVVTYNVCYCNSIVPRTVTAVVFHRYESEKRQHRPFGSLFISVFFVTNNVRFYVLHSSTRWTQGRETAFFPISSKTVMFNDPYCSPIGRLESGEYTVTQKPTKAYKGISLLFGRYNERSKLQKTMF